MSDLEHQLRETGARLRTEQRSPRVDLAAATTSSGRGPQRRSATLVVVVLLLVLGLVALIADRAGNHGHARVIVAGPSTASTSSPRATDFNSPPYTRGIEVGRTYKYSMYTHCGINKAKIDGTWWRASPPQDDKNGNPPDGWNDAIGTLKIVSENKAVYTLGNGLTATFVRDNLPRLICN